MSKRAKRLVAAAVFTTTTSIVALTASAGLVVHNVGPSASFTSWPTATSSTPSFVNTNPVFDSGDGGANGNPSSGNSGTNESDDGSIGQIYTETIFPTTTFSLGAISLSLSGSPHSSANTSLQLFQLKPYVTPTTGGYNLASDATGSELLGGGSGLSFQFNGVGTGNTGNALYEFDFNNTTTNDQVTLTAGTGYVLELWNQDPSGSNNIYFQRAGTSLTWPSGKNYGQMYTTNGVGPASYTDNDPTARNQINTAGRNALIAVYPAPTVATSSSTWNVNASGDYNVAGNWTNGVPNGSGATATFGSVVTSNTTVYSNSNISDGTINFNSSNTYQVTGTGSLTLQVASGSAGINVLQAGTQEINIPLTIASNTVFNVASGSTLLIANPVTINAGLSLTKTGAGTVTYQSIITLMNGSSIAFSSSTNANSLILNSSALATVAAHGNGTKNLLQLTNLSVASGAALNLNDDDLIVHSSSLSTVTSEVKAGFNNGFWNGSGGINSASASTDSSHLHAIGTIQNSANGSSGGMALYSSFDGASVTSSDVLVKYTYYGDANLDGKVDASDYSRIDAAYVAHTTGWFNGDFNYDGVVNGSDYTLIDNAFDTQGAQISSAIGGIFASSTAEIAAVPEPATLGLTTAIITTTLLSRRKRVS